MKCFSLETPIFYQGLQSKLIIRDPRLIMGDPKFYQRPRLKLNIRNPTLFIGDPPIFIGVSTEIWGFQNYSRALILIQILVCCKQTFAELSNCEKIYPTNGKTAFSNQKYLGLGGGNTVFLKNCKWNPKTKDSKFVTV